MWEGEDGGLDRLELGCGAYDECVRWAAGEWVARWVLTGVTV